MQDSRGRGHSEGVYRAFQNDISDGYDTVEWLAAQSWSDGNMGITGGSAMGMAANSAAVANPPHLKAAYVIAAPDERPSFVNSVFKQRDTGGWLERQGAGKVLVELFASTDGLDTDFVAKLVDVYPDGYEALVLDAPLRTRYRNGHDEEDVEMMTPGRAEKMIVDLWTTAITFEKGHRIALHITSSSDPRFEINPNTGEAPGVQTLKPRRAKNTIFHDAAHPTALVLPVIYPN